MKRSKHMAGRLLAMALAAVMCMGMSVTVFAAEGDGDGGNKEPAGVRPGFNAIADAKEDGTQTNYPGGMASWEDIRNGTNGVTQNLNIETYSAGVDTVNGMFGDRALIKVTGIEPGVNVMAYRIIKAEYENAGHFSHWADLTDVDFVDENGSVQPGSFSKENIAKAAVYVRDNGVDGTKMDPADKSDVEGKTTYTAEVAPGAYVVIVSGGETHTYGAMVVSASYTAMDSIDGESLELVANQAFAKMQSEPEIDKYITWSDSRNTANGKSADIEENTGGKGVAASYGTGDIVYFDILVKNIPDYKGDKILFKITDKMDKGLELAEFNNDYDIQYGVFFGEIGDKYASDSEIDTDYKKEKTDIGGKFNYDKDTGTLTWDWADAEAYSSGIGKWAGCDMVIRYGAKITDTAGYNDKNWAEMKNGVRLDFTHNSLVKGDNDYTIDLPKRVYTFALDVKKEAAENNEPLGGAMFCLYTATDNGRVDGKIVIDSIPENVESSLFVTIGGDVTDPFDDATYKFKPAIVTTGEDGMATFKGLAPGKYYMREVKAPGSYTLNDHAYEIEITPEYDAVSDANVAKLVEGVPGDKYDVQVLRELTKVSYKLDSGEDAHDMSDDIVVLDTKMVALPSTGGAGTAILVGVGVVGLIVGMFIIFGSRKKEDQ